MNFAPIDLTQIILAILTIIGGIVARYVIPWIIENTDEKKRFQIANTIDVLVEAADRLMKTSSGEERLKYVLEGLEAKGYHIDIDDVHNEYRVLIEAAVERLRIAQNASKKNEVQVSEE